MALFPNLAKGARVNNTSPESSSFTAPLVRAHEFALQAQHRHRHLIANEQNYIDLMEWDRIVSTRKILNSISLLKPHVV
ncbi:unnamed protein product [Clavelina lepadiformis]|uniref:Uncharacterized protein n=1 Tax=Clavelina lepadiformis TaxID=159417 RepID=A0ABP0GCX6_CLALP